MEPLRTFQQAQRHKSARPLNDQIGSLLWQYTWFAFCIWTPRPFNAWRVLFLKLFGAKITGFVSVHPRARIEVPWKLIMHESSCIGDRANIYNLDIVELGARCTVAQEVYLCTGTHDFSDANLALQVAKILVQPDAFIGARSLVLPGVTIGKSAVIGAGSVVTKDMPDGMICAGNPCKPIRARPGGTL